MNRLLTIADFRPFLSLFNAKMKSKSDFAGGFNYHNAIIT